MGAGEDSLATLVPESLSRYLASVCGAGTVEDCRDHSAESFDHVLPPAATLRVSAIVLSCCGWAHASLYACRAYICGARDCDTEKVPIKRTARELHGGCKRIAELVFPPSLRLRSGPCLQPQLCLPPRAPEFHRPRHRRPAPSLPRCTTAEMLPSQQSHGGK